MELPSLHFGHVTGKDGGPTSVASVVCPRSGVGMLSALDCKVTQCCPIGVSTTGCGPSILGPCACHCLHGLTILSVLILDVHMLLFSRTGVVSSSTCTPSLQVGRVFIGIFDWCDLALPSPTTVLAALFDLFISLNSEMCRCRRTSVCVMDTKPICPHPFA